MAKKLETSESNDRSEQAIDFSYLGSREETAEGRTVASRKRLREQLSSDVEAFLAKGGKISEVDPNETSDPPKRPESHYGQRPI